MRLGLRNRILLNFVLVMAAFLAVGGLWGTYFIDRVTMEEEQRRVGVDLRAAWSVLQGRLRELSLLAQALGPGRRVALALSQPQGDLGRSSLEAVRLQMGLDFLGLTDAEGRVVLRAAPPYQAGDDLANDPYIAQALTGQHAQGFAVLAPQRLKAENRDLEERAFIAFEATPKAKPRAKDSEDAGLVMMAAAPLRDQQGRVLGVLYCGLLLNRNHALVDRIADLVFEGQKLGGRPVGTVTIFQWDVRVATNVVQQSGQRALGTRVSAEVYDRVLENDGRWYDQAFVVNDWYISAYEPIHDLGGRVIGILYVGVLAKKYDQIRAGLWRANGVLILAAAGLVALVGLVFAWRLTGAVRRLAEASGRIAGGQLDLRVPEPRADDELRDLTRAFNHMALSLRERQEKLQATRAQLEASNQSLQKLNRNYMEMLGFVSHELKNALGVVFTSARTLEMGLVGPLSPGQAQLAGAIVRNIEAAVAMSREYLDLSRIEKGELTLQARDLDLIAEVVTPILQELAPALAQRDMRLINDLPESLPLFGDPSLLKVVCKNLLDNALKYGQPGGEVRLSHRAAPQGHVLEFYNQGPGLSHEDLGRLFGKFVRLGGNQGDRKGTGLGLFITREIVRLHGGDIQARSEEGQWISFLVSLPATGDGGTVAGV